MKKQQDGYIKNKQREIKDHCSMILAKYSVTILLLIIPVLIVFGLLMQPGPEEWQEETVTLSQLRQEKLGARRHRDKVFVTTDGRKFALPSDLEQPTFLLNEGESYTIVYSDRFFVKDIQGMTCGSKVLYDIFREISSWEHDQKVAHGIAIGSVVAEILAVILIDRLWCKSEYANIRKCKEKIALCENRMEIERNKRTDFPRPFGQGSMCHRPRR